MHACLHQEFDNAEGEEYQADVSALASPASQNGPEVYVLPLTEVSLPVSKQPGRSSKKPQMPPLNWTCFYFLSPFPLFLPSFP